LNTLNSQNYHNPDSYNQSILPSRLQTKLLLRTRTQQYIQNLNNREPAGSTKPFTANVSDPPNYPRQANTGYAAPRAETINLIHQTKTEFGLPYPQCLPGPVKVRGPQNSPSSRPVYLGFEVDANEINSRVTSIKTKRQNETSVDYLLRSPPTHTNQCTDDSLGRDGKFSKFSRRRTSAWQQTMGRCYVNGSMYIFFI